MAAQIEAQVQLLDGPLLPLLPPKPLARSLPPLPTRPVHARDEIHPGWHRDTLVLPAAYPRSFSNSTRRHGQVSQDPTVPRPGEARADVQKATEFVVRSQVEGFARPVTLADSKEIEGQEQLVVVGNRYRPKKHRDPNAPTGLTLVLSHANGFYKEVWEPVLEVVLAQIERRGLCLPVDEIWALDCVIQGDSAVLNDGVLGSVFNWADHGRDLVNTIAYYLDSPDLENGVQSETQTPSLPKPSPTAPPELARLDSGPSAPKSHPAPSKRLIVGIGHSLGGGATAFAATACPSLFSSVIFLDPVIVPANPNTPRTMITMTTAALKRRATWKTREEAKESLGQKAMFRAWASEVLDGYIDHGLHETDDGQVTLKTKPFYEALTFMDPLASASRRACVRLETLPKSLPAHFIFADKGRSVLNEEWIDHILNQTIPQATFARVKDAGHLIVHEKPVETAELIVEFLEKAHPRSVARSAKL